MPVFDLRRRRRNSRLDPARRAVLRAALAEGLGALLRGERADAHDALDRVHAGARNAPLLHLGVHLGRLAALLSEGQGRAALAELSPVLGAAPSSLWRRLQGVDPDAPAGPGLRGRWRQRRAGLK